MPNNNNWLSFNIPDNVREQLCIVQSEIQNEYNFNPMSYNDLHMTIYFFGEKIRNKNIYYKVGQIINSIFNKNEYKFKFKGYSYFPYNKPHYIVALYDIDSDTNNLVKQLNNEISKLGIGLNTEFNIYTPHITLGKIKGKYEQSELNYTKSTDFISNGTYMCGRLDNYMK